jgi:energy-coupling factor transporter ATP-binding protein EcfA2
MKIFYEMFYNTFLVEQKLKKNEEGTKEKSPDKTTKVKQATHNVVLKSIEHQYGVNAIKEGTVLPFHPRLTVIFGKNGSGKSGYVRIFKKIAGSKTQEDVWQNVHTSKSQNDCSAKINFSWLGKDDVKEWSGEKGLPPFNQMSVFDGKCIPVYLTESLEFSYQPYGFELFQILSASMQKLQDLLQADIHKYTYETPDIDDLFASGTTIGTFVTKINFTTKVEDLDKLPQWNDESKKKLADRKKEQRGLQNLDQQFEILSTRRKKIKAMENALEEISSDLSAEHIKTYFKILERLLELKKLAATKKGETLADFKILEMESNEWSAFIDAGEDYIRLVKDDEYPADNDHCIYCHQKLSKTAQKLIKLYRELFEEDETADLSAVEERFESSLSELESLSYVENFPYEKSDYHKIIPKKTIDSVFDALKVADELSIQIVSSLKSKKKPTKIVTVKTVALLNTLSKAREKIETEEAELQETQRNLYRKSQELTKEITELEDIKLFFSVRKKVESNIRAVRWTARATPLVGTKLSTKSITALGMKAWNELVSESFKGKFRKEAQYLNAPIVSLDFRGEYGAQKRNKTFEGISKIDQLLSEGEQKAVALADFFAELSFKEKTAPVVFDDPANSFDHDRKDLIAKRIVEESNSHQVIVFTHDLMFADYLFNNVLKEGQNKIDKDKAIFHSLYSDAETSGFVDVDYYPTSVKFDDLINRIEGRISKIETLSALDRTEEIKSAYSQLRTAVEKAVEEKIFGGVVLRWSERIQLLNASKATLNKPNLLKADELHALFSAYCDAHNQSSEKIMHMTPTLSSLKSDIELVKGLSSKVNQE